MALQVSKIIKGIDATYHKVINNNIDLLAGDAVIIIASYKDKATRDADDEAYLTTRRHVLKPTITEYADEVVDGETESVPTTRPFFNATPPDKNNTAEAYARLKELPDWANAVDA